MITPETYHTPCTECAGQQYCLTDRKIEVSTQSTLPRMPFVTESLYGTFVFCGTCGHSTFYVSNPAEQMAEMERRERRRQELLQEDAQGKQPRKRKGLF